MQKPQITISLRKKELTLKTATETIYTFPIAIGKPQTPTPKGIWHIQNKKQLTDIGVYGTHWLGLDDPGYGIHGTNQPELIGQEVSAGCIRMRNADIQYLFAQVSIGTPVIIMD